MSVENDQSNQSSLTPLIIGRGKALTLSGQWRALMKIGRNLLNFGEWYVPAGAALLTAVLLLPLASRSVDFHHDGVMLKPAIDVLSGRTLFRDTFTQYGALTTYIHALALKVYPSLISLRLITVFAYSIAVFFLVSSWMMFLPRRLAIVAWLLFLVFIPYFDSYWPLKPWSSVLALMFQSIAIFGLFNCIRQKKLALWGAVTGSSVALVFWCRPPVGVPLCVAVLFAFVVLTWSGWQILPSLGQRLWRSMAISFVVTNFLFIFNILVSGSLHAWIFQNYTWSKTYLKSTGVAGMPPWRRFMNFVRPQDGITVAVIVVALLLPLTIRDKKAVTLHRKIILISCYYCLLGLCLFLYYRHGVLDLFTRRTIWSFFEFFNFASKSVLDLFTFPTLWIGDLHGGLAFFIPLVVIVGLGTLFLLSLRRRYNPNPTDFFVLALGCVSGASLLQYYPVFTIEQHAFSLSPAFGVFVYFVWRGLQIRTVLTMLVIGIMFFPAFLQKVNLTRENLARPLVELERPFVLKGMKVSCELARYLATLDKATQKILDKAPDTPIAIIGDDALYSTFAHNHWNPSPFFIEWAGLMSDEGLKLRRANIHQRRPIVLFQKPPWSDSESLNLADVETFKKSEHYVTIAEIPFQPVGWWMAGQHERDMSTAESELRSMVVVAPEELVQDKMGQ